MRRELTVVELNGAETELPDVVADLVVRVGEIQTRRAAAALEPRDRGADIQESVPWSMRPDVSPRIDGFAVSMSALRRFTAEADDTALRNNANAPAAVGAENDVPETRLICESVPARQAALAEQERRRMCPARRSRIRSR